MDVGKRTEVDSKTKWPVDGLICSEGSFTGSHSKGNMQPACQPGSPRQVVASRNAQART